MDKYNFDFNFIKAGAPVVTVSALGLAFNSLSRSLLKYPETINIGFDEENKTIGVQANDKGLNLASFEFESKEKNGWVRIGCKDFVRYLATITSIDFSNKAKQFIARYDNDNQMLIVTINETNLKDKKSILKEK